MTTLDGDGKHSMGQTYDFSELQGLSREQALNGGAVKFSLVREAGTIDCEGSFQDGRGSGTFRFTGSQAFVSGMKSRGFDFERNSSKHDRGIEDRLFSAAALNVTTALADDLSSAGFKLDVDCPFILSRFQDRFHVLHERSNGFPNSAWRLVTLALQDRDDFCASTQCDLTRTFESRQDADFVKSAESFVRWERGVSQISILKASKMPSQIRPRYIRR